ncbi:cytochrome P450 [Aspergillus unguis]
MSLTAALVGILSHVFYFRRGEHHLHGVFYLQLLVAVIIASVAFLVLAEHTLSTALSTTFHFVSSYLLGLYTSLLTYRIILHPLTPFPGPLLPRLSTVFTSTPHSHSLHLSLYNLHQKYGPYVRIGSSDLSIAHPDALEIVYGAGSRCKKGLNYELSMPTTSLQLMRDPEQHHVRRRVWSRAFSDRLLRGYELRMRDYRRRLVGRIRELAAENEPVDIRKWFDLYSFDVMGDLAFGEGFGSLERGEAHWAVRLLGITAGAVGMFLPAWLFYILARVPGAAGEFWRFVDFSGERLVQRFRNDPEIPDLSASLFAPLKGRDILDITEEERNTLYGDARLILIAGSDTTAGALSTIFYELLRNPAEIDKLRAELAPYLDNGTTEFPHSKIQHLEHLNGVINEALRLYPAVPSALQRITPPEGIVVDGTHIPGGVQIYTPMHTIGRSDLAYERPLEFIPERWYSRPDLVKNKNAFAPFSLGPFNCIGRPLALMNLRTTIAQLIMEFDIALAPGEDGKRFLDDSQDNFVYYFGKLDVVFTPRLTG